MMIFKRLLLAMTSLVLLSPGFGQDTDSGAGAVILAERTDPWSFAMRKIKRSTVRK